MTTTKKAKTKYKVCPICNTKFKPTSKNQKYCSKECSKVAIKEREKSSAYIETRKKYAKSENRKISNKKYLSSEKGKESIKKYMTSEKGKEAVKKAIKKYMENSKATIKTYYENNKEKLQEYGRNYSKVYYIKKKNNTTIRKENINIENISIAYLIL